MKNTTLTIVALCGYFLSFSQSTAVQVYDIFQAKCVSCHGNANPAAQLDLEGNGATLQDQQISVYQGLLNQIPTDPEAAATGHAYIYPGRTDMSLLFHQMNDGLDDYVERYNVSATHPQLTENQQLTIEEKELIRQWIVFGAPANGEVADMTLIDQFYNEAGLKSFPDGAPEPPSTAEGFQIKLGPFFMEPGGEEEYYQKYELDLPDDVEVTRMDVKIGTFSHHMIVYNYDTPQAANNVRAGLRDEQEHDAIGFVATVAESQDIVLPAKTAFFWQKNDVLELNPHYINYSAELPYQAEVYINVYTSPKGTAKQEMRSTLVPNFNIFIPNDGDERTFTRPVIFNAELFVWQLGGHTHRYGTDYKIWKRNSNGSKGDMIYDGECPNGVPDCNVPFFDYQHIPNRVFDELLPIDFNKGVIHAATYLNDGPETVSWGPTSEDEMMLFAMMFVTDTTGLGGNIATPTAKVTDVSQQIEVAPNPFRTATTLTLPTDFGLATFRLFDALGREVRRTTDINQPQVIIEKGELVSGIYWYQVENERGEIGTGKLIVE
ncbi:MAG: T9SS type A sorting domain-containing protein [Saprospiraceae bacterium]